MRIKIDVSAKLVNPDGEWQDSTEMDVPEGKETEVCAAMVRGVHAAGGLLEILAPNKVRLIPIERVKDITAEAHSVLLANANDVRTAAANQAVGAAVANAAKAPGVFKL